MPRNGSGVASVVNTFTPLTTADANEVNANFTDIASEITNSLPRDGQAGMTGQLLAISGTQTEPGIAFNADPNTGFRRPSGDSMAAVCGGTDILTVSTTEATVTVPVAVNDAPTTGDHLTNKTYVDARSPTGEIKMWPVSTAPTGFLECDGSAVSRTTYAALFAVIGTVWGTGDGSTTFNVPDLRGEFVRGWDHGRGVDTGRVFASAQLDAFQNITGGFTSRRTASAEDLADWTGAFYDNGTGGSDLSVDVAGAVLRRQTGFDASRSPSARTSTETRPRNRALMFIIKT